MMNKNKILLYVFAGMAVLAIIAAIYFFIQKNKEEQAKIDAFNDLAAQSEVVQEREQTWSKLSFQKDELINELRNRNESLANTIENRDESILALSQERRNFLAENMLELILRQLISSGQKVQNNLVLRWLQILFLQADTFPEILH